MLESIDARFEPPSFVAHRASHAAANTTLWTPAHQQPASSPGPRPPPWSRLFSKAWLGQRPRSQLQVSTCPIPDERALRNAHSSPHPSVEASPRAVAEHPRPSPTHAWMQSPRAWLSEGVAALYGNPLGRETARTHSRLEELRVVTPPLALIEPASPGIGAGQAPGARHLSHLLPHQSHLCFWMLRMWPATLPSPRPARLHPTADNSLGYLATTDRLLREASRTGQRAPRSLLVLRRLVDADKGLPDLTIDSVFPRPAHTGQLPGRRQHLTQVYASAEVPVT